MNQFESKVIYINIMKNSGESLTEGEERYNFRVIEEENVSQSNDSGMESSNASLPIKEISHLNNISSINQVEINDICSSIVNDIHNVYKEYTSEIESQLEIPMDFENSNYSVIPPNKQKESTANVDYVEPNNIIDSIGQTDPIKNLTPDTQKESTEILDIEEQNNIIDSIVQTDPVENLTPDNQIESTQIVDDEKHNNIIDFIDISDEDENNEQPETKHISPVVNLTKVHKLKRAKNVKKILPLFKKKINFNIKFLNKKPVDELVNPNIIVSNGYQLCMKDLLLLVTPKCWLNDVIIQNYISLIARHCNQPVLELNTDFVISFKQYGYKSIYKWFKTKYPSLINYKRIVIPINPNRNHWALVVVEIWEGKIYSLDSFNYLNMAELKLISEFLNQIFIDYSQDSGVEMPIPNNWEYKQWNSPNQSNVYDCGVFTCTNARYFLFDRFPEYTESDILLLRHRMAWELINNTIIPF